MKTTTVTVLRPSMLGGMTCEDEFEVTSPKDAAEQIQKYRNSNDGYVFELRTRRFWKWGETSLEYTYTKTLK